MSGKKALIGVSSHVSDLPYRLLTELNYLQNNMRILAMSAGSCTPKHLLMAEAYQQLGYALQ